MENRPGKFEEMETQAEPAENHIPHIHMGVLDAGTGADTQ